MPAASDVLARICAVMTRVFHLPEEAALSRATTASDIKGWDSLSHAMLILNVEEEFGVDLPLDRTYALANVGELVDLVTQAQESGEPRSILICGDAQAEALSVTMSHMPSLARRFRLRYYESAQFEDQPPPDEELATCRFFFEQHGPAPLLDPSRLPNDCTRVTFPACTFTALWPFTCANAYAAPEGPQYPGGRFPYGHRLVVEGLDRGDSRDEILSSVRSDHWEQQWPGPAATRGIGANATRYARSLLRRRDRRVRHRALPNAASLLGAEPSRQRAPRGTARASARRGVRQ